MSPAAARSIPDVPAYPIPVDRVVVEVVADPANPGGRLVLQDGVESSYIDIAHPERLGFEYQRHLAGVVDVMHPRRHSLSAFQIGGGPCAVMRYLDTTRREFRGRVAELDPGVIDVAERYLGLVQGPRLRMSAGDGRAALTDLADASMDVVIVDAFLGLVVPHPLVTVQFTVQVARVLRHGGLHLTNLIDIAPHGLARSFAATLLAAGGDVAILADQKVLDDGASGNFVIVSSRRVIPTELIARRSARDPEPWQLLGGKALRRWIGDATPLDDNVPPDHELARFGDLFGRSRPASGGGQQ